MSGNLGYLFNKKVYEKISRNSENSYKLNTKNGIIEDIKNYKLEKNEECILGNQDFRLVVQYPGMVIGIGYNHGISDNNDFKMGFFFDYTSGLPIIPASSIKGIIRHVFKNSNGNHHLKEEYKKYLKEKIGIINKSIYVTNEYLEKLELEIFCGILKSKTEEKRLNIYEKDVFFDAIIVNSIDRDKRILDDDYITPHEKEKIKNPIPLKFLKIRSGTNFKFIFGLKDSKVKDKKGNVLKAEDKKNLFKEIILDFGVGAKTNVGYGFLKEQGVVKQKY